MPRNWVSSFAPLGAGLIVILMLLVSGLVNRQNESGCAYGVAAAGCRPAAQLGGFAAGPVPDRTLNAGRDFQRLQAPTEPGMEPVAAAPLSLYLLAASLFLTLVTLAVVVLVAGRQRRLELVQRGTDDGNAVTTERIIKLVDSVATVIRALEERTRELETGVKAFGAAKSAQDQELAERLASAVAALGAYQQTLADEFLPSIARRDERLVAIDANLTAVTDRLARLGADAAQNAEDTAVLAECFRSLEASVSELTNSLIEQRPLPPERPSDARPSAASDEATAGPARSAASDEAVDSYQSVAFDEAAGVEPRPVSGDEQDSGAGSADAAPSEDMAESDAPGGQPPRDG